MKETPLRLGHTPNFHPVGVSLTHRALPGHGARWPRPYMHPRHHAKHNTHPLHIPNVHLPSVPR